MTAPDLAPDQLQNGCIFDEALRHLAGRHLLAPSVMDHEVVNVALNKLRRGMAADAVQLGFDDYFAHGVDLCGTDLQGQFALAQRYALSSCDAAYLWLAAELKAPLATFDRKLNQAAHQHLGTLE